MPHHEIATFRSDVPAELARVIADEYGPEALSSLASAAVRAAMATIPPDHSYERRNLTQVAERTADFLTGKRPLPQEEGEQ
jgi:hypothetical protein